MGKKPLWVVCANYQVWIKSGLKFHSHQKCPSLWSLYLDSKPNSGPDYLPTKNSYATSLNWKHSPVVTLDNILLGFKYPPHLSLRRKLAECLSAWCSCHWRPAGPAEFAPAEPARTRGAGARGAARRGCPQSRWRSRTAASGRTLFRGGHGFAPHDPKYLHKCPAVRKSKIHEDYLALFQGPGGKVTPSLDTNCQGPQVK